MRKVFLWTTCAAILSGYFLTQGVVAKEKEDKGPLSKKVFIHYKKAKAKSGQSGKPTKPTADDEYYTYIADGAKWKTTENYVVNLMGAPEGFQDAIEESMETWDCEVSFGLFGELSRDDSAQADITQVDGSNVIVFGSLSDPGVIAVTYVWGYFSGRRQTREIVEMDMIFNTDGITWGNVDDDDSVMDMQNIATHELGHAAGMGDLYNPQASKETMYGYSSEGEISKRDLYNGDVAGVTALYQ